MLRKFILVIAAFLLVLGIATFSDGNTAQAAALHSTIPTKALTCTPNQYYWQDSEAIYDQGTGYTNVIGQVNILADGCGWVYASAAADMNGGVINHLEIHRSGDGSLVTAASYNGSFENSTIHVDVGNTEVYAVGVVQVPSPAYWGRQTTFNTNGYA